MILLVSLLIIGVIATYSGKIAEKFKLPALIGMMVLGIIIGPSFLNVVPNNTLGNSINYKRYSFSYCIIYSRAWN